MGDHVVRLGASQLVGQLNGRTFADMEHHQVSNLVLIETAEPHDLDRTVDAEIAEEVGGILTGFSAPKGRHDGGTRHRPPDDMTEHEPRGRLGPMQVVDHEQQGAFGGNGSDQAGDGFQQPPSS